MERSNDHAELEAGLARMLGSYDARDDTNGVRFALASPRRDWSWAWASPGSPEQYFIASTTKLHVSAILMQLRNEGRVDLDVPTVTYLDPSIMAGIHVLRCQWIVTHKHAWRTYTPRTATYASKPSNLSSQRPIAR